MIILGAGAGGMRPSAPTIGTATAGDTTASVAFTPSTYIGKGTITYTATSSPGGFTGTASSSPITVSGLTNGTAYTFTVVGTTNYGVASAASAASNSITPAAAGAFESIQTVTSSSAFFSAQFNSIPQTYKHLQIRVFYGESRTANDVDYLRVKVNGRNANYWRLVYGQWNQVAQSGNTTGNDAFYSSLSAVSNGSTYTNTFGGGIFYFMDYTNTNKKPNLMGWTGVATETGYTAAAHAGMTSNTANENISSIEVLIEPTLNFKAYSHVALYGIKG
ncbi:hypothetical protein EB001_02190 [bacterium]|nr:hypothetical protein [bacterium]